MIMERLREPIRFDWHNRKHTILETCYAWNEQSGNSTLMHFSVRTEEALFELVYNTKEQSWSIHGIEVK
jgi:hypothetical protein